MLDLLFALLLGLATPCAYEDGPAPCYFDGGRFGTTDTYTLILEDR